MKTIKTFFSIVLAVFVCVSMIPFSNSVVKANAVLQKSGQCGENAYWNFEETSGELTISGSGALFDNAFANQQDIRSVIIEEGITTVSYRAFWQCTNLRFLNLPDSLKTIDKYAFARTGLTTLRVPKNVSYIAPGFVMHCIKLRTLFVDPENVYYEQVVLKDTAATIILNEALTEVVQYPMGLEETIVKIPDSVTRINDLAFNCAFYLQNIVLSRNLEYIGECAFGLCAGLKKVVIPETVETIEWEAFVNCYQLKDVYVLSKNISISSKGLCKHYKKLVGISENEAYKKAVSILKNGSLFDLLDFQAKYLVDVNPSQAYGTIHCKKNSTVETYAKNNGITCDNSINFIDGYNYQEDSYAFGNFNERTSKKDCQAMFGKTKGSLVYKLFQSAPVGLCYGMAYTTGSILESKPKISSFAGKSNIGEIEPNSYNNEMKITAKEFIKYAHVYQLTAKVQLQVKSLFNKGIKNVYNEVKNNLKEEPIIIHVEDHAVLAVGIDKNTIYVNDSNCNMIQPISINGSNWSYLNYGSDKGDSIVYSKIDSTVYEKRKNLGDNFNLVTSNGEFLIFASNDDNIIEITDLYGETDEVETTKEKSYWVEENEDLYITNNGENKGDFLLATDEMIIGIDLPRKSEAVISTKTSEIMIDTSEREDVSVSFTFIDEVSVKELRIECKDIENKINIKIEEGKVVTTDVDNATISLLKDEKIIKTEDIVCSNGNNEIEIAKDEFNVYYEEKHVDSNNDEICDGCNKDVETQEKSKYTYWIEMIIKLISLLYYLISIRYNTLIA